MIKKNSKLFCPNCKKVAFIAKNDLQFSAPIKSADIKTPFGDCHSGEQIKCIHCGFNYLDIRNSSKWVFDD